MAELVKTMPVTSDDAGARSAGLVFLGHILINVRQQYGSEIFKLRIS